MAHVTNVRGVRILGGWAPRTDVSGEDWFVPIYKHEKAIWKGSHSPTLGGLTIIMGINHLLTGMILQVVTIFQCHWWKNALTYCSNVATKSNEIS